MAADEPSGGWRAVFLDRDGTVNVEAGYLYSGDRVQLIDGAAAAIRALNDAGWLVVIITNQSGVSRGYLSAADLDAVHEALLADVAALGGRIDAVYACPHVPGERCACRKPRPELLQRAAERFGIDLAASWMIGDKPSDLGAGRAAGCRTGFVLTGYGSRYAPSLDSAAADFIAADLPAAVRLILSADPAERRLAEPAGERGDR